MPAAAVYVVAIVGTIGAAIAFKHFVFDPHVRPAVGRWIEALRQNQRRRGALVEAADTDELEVPMRERRKSSNTNSHESDDDGENGISHRPTSSYEQGRRFRVRADVPMSGRSSYERMSSSSIELDDLVASEVHEWRNEIVNSSGQDLRHRRPAQSDLLNEAVSSIPYVPLSPRQTHVPANSSLASPATPSVTNRLPTPPTSPLLVSMVGGGGDVQSLPSPPPTTPPSTWITSLSGSDEGLYSPSFGGSLPQPDSPERQLRLMQNASKTRATSGSGEVVTAAGGSIQSSIPTLTGVSLSQLSPPPSSVGEASANASPYLQHRNVPSLSQSYPQDLDAEHGLELLSAPSSRADSPFSLADISPRPPVVNILDRNRTLNESIGNGSGGSIDWSPARTPSRTFVSLDNESFGTLSPAVGPRQLALRAAGVGIDAGNNLQQRRTSPLAPSHHLEPPTTNEPGATTPQSMTSSAKSTNYMSFSEGEDDDNVPLAVRRASLVSNPSDPLPSPRRSQGLGLTFIPPIENNSSNLDPVTAAPALLNPSMLSPRTQLAQVPALPPSVSQLNSERGQALSDSDLSELDLMSDFAPSEGDLVFIDSPTAGAVAPVVDNNNNGASAADNDTGHQTQTRGDRAYESDLESDAGWSLAGGSDVGGRTSTPQSPQSRLGASGYLTRGGTLRARH